MEITTRHSQSPLYRWASLRTELLWIYDGPVMPEARKVLSDHSMGYWVWLVRRGTVQVEMEGRTWKAGAGQWMVSPQGTANQEFSDDSRILSIHFRCQWPAGDNLFGGREAIVWSARDFPRLEKSATSLCRLVHRHFPRVRLTLSEKAIDFPVFLRFEQRLLQWLIDFHEAMTASGRNLAQAGDCDDRLLRAAHCLHESPLEDAFPADRLQRETGLGRAHLDRLYWKEFGVTTREYWERLRQESAVRNLESTSLSVKEIGYQLGFKQASHFTKWFSQRTGLTPKSYREQAPQKRVA
ncbi:AraC family transcriptional regulator [Verrucomicrobia bacterium LW23]|nr:AraC family transcriptional regulator [Verrucomicrobia bacterium LW23]